MHSRVYNISLCNCAKYEQHFFAALLTVYACACVCMRACVHACVCVVTTLVCNLNYIYNLHYSFNNINLHNVIIIIIIITLFRH